MAVAEEPDRAPVLVVEEVELPEDDLVHARALGNPVVILPSRRAEDGRGVYDEGNIFLVKDLRATGVDVAYLDPSDARLFEVRKSAIAADLVTIILGICSSAGWDGIKALLTRGHSADNKLEVTYTDLGPGSIGRSWTVRGRAEDVIAVIERLQSEPPSAPS